VFTLENSTVSCSVMQKVSVQFWAAWSSGRCPCLWQGGWNEMI